MRRAPRRPFRLTVLAIAFALTGLSCGDPRTTPGSSDARESLRAALDAWRSGKKPTDLASVDPPIHVVESEWTDGRKLSEFEILREVPSETDKRFAVKLVRVPPAPKDEEVVYIVLGGGPLSVYRDKDYERTMNMDNNPVLKKKGR